LTGVGTPFWPFVERCSYALFGVVALRKAIGGEPEVATRGMGRAPSHLTLAAPPLDNATRIQQALARVFAEAQAAGPGIGPRGLTAKMSDLDPIGQRVGLVRELIRRYSGSTAEKRYSGISAAFRELSASIVSQKTPDGQWATPEKDWGAEARALFDWTRQHVRYVRDPRYRDWFSAPDRTLAVGAEDCDGLSIVLGTLLTAIGFPVRLRVIQTDRSKDYDHIYLGTDVSDDKGQWIALDASVAQPAGWEAPGAAQVVAQGTREAGGAIVAPGGKALGRVVRVRDFAV
jgi:hypothetical protein